MHCMRLTQMSREIAEGKGVIVRRPNAEFLIGIRKGKVNLQTLIENVEANIKEIDKIFEESNLPDAVEEGFINNLIIEIRKKHYNI